MRRPEIILFDVYGTLAGFDPPRELIQQRAAAEFGMELDAAGIGRGYRDADQFMSDQNSSSPVRLMKPEERDRFFARYEQLVLAGAGHDVDLETAGRVWSMVRSQEYSLALFDDVVPGLRSLREAGFRTGALSNMAVGERELCDAMGLTGLVEFVVTSGDAGVEKPDPRIFLAALKRADVEPAVALMVGDSIRSDLRPAVELGMQAVLVDRYGNHPRHDEHPRVADIPGLLALLGVE